MKKIIIIIFISSFIWVFFSYLFLNFSESKNINFLEKRIISVSKKSSLSVVSIIEENKLDFFENKNLLEFNKRIWWWTGFFINKKWIIITNNHVVKNKNSKYIVILKNWQKISSKLIYSNEKKDIALLKIDYKNKNYLKIINENKKLQIWQFVISIWNSFTEFNNSVKFWIISWLNRKIKNYYINLDNLIQSDLNINSWDSWWPLINLEWKVIWINTLIVDWSQKISFAISITQKEIDEYLKKLKM